MSYQGSSGNAYLASARAAGRMASRDRREAATAREIRAAEDAFDAARDAEASEPFVRGAPRPAYDAYCAARDALDAIDPGNYRFS